VDCDTIDAQYRKYMQKAVAELCIHEAAARTATRGLWAAKERPIAPWEWRRKEKRLSATSYSAETAANCIARIGKQ
jgi:hypothetical protein